MSEKVMFELRASYLRKIQLAMLVLGLIGVGSFFVLWSLGYMILPFAIILEASAITILIGFALYRVISFSKYDELSTDLILLSFGVHCVVVYFLVPHDPLRVVWFHLMIVLVFLFKDMKAGILALCIPILVVLFGNTFVFYPQMHGYFDLQLLWTFVITTLMIGGAAGVMNKYYNALAQHVLDLSRFDGMTDALNARAFKDECMKFLPEAARIKFDIYFVVMDFDDFKMINDEKGHPVGDKVLIVFSHLVKQSFQELAIFGRLGGDEFGLLTINSSLDQHLTERKIEQIKYDLSVAIGFPIGISYGIVNSSEHNFEFDEIYRGADKKMYKAKAA